MRKTGEGQRDRCPKGKKMMEQGEREAARPDVTLGGDQMKLGKTKTPERPLSAGVGGAK